MSMAHDVMLTWVANALAAERLRQRGVTREPTYDEVDGERLSARAITALGEHRPVLDSAGEVIGFEWQMIARRIMPEATS